MSDTLTFNGKSFADFGVFFDGSKSFVTPEKDVEFVEVPGRNGSLSFDNNRFKDLVITYPCFIRGEFISKFREFEQFLYSTNGFQRLECSKEPNHYRMAQFVSVIEPRTTAFNKSGFFDIEFRCHPQRFLKSGESAQSVTPSSETLSGSTVSVPNPSGLSAVSDLKADIEPVQDLHGYSYPWVGGAGKNLLNPGTITKSGDITYASDVWTMNPFTTSSQIIGLPFASYIGETVSVSFTAWASGEAVMRFDGQPDSVYPSGTDFSDKTINLTANKQRFSYSGTILEGTTRFRLFRTSAFDGAQSATVYVENIQVELGSTATDYAPYSNICPISGHTQATVYRNGKNLLPNNWVQRTTNGVTFTPQSNGRVRVYGTATDYTTYSDSFTWTGDTGVYYFNGCPEGSATTFDTFIYDADAGQRARKRDGVTPCDSCYSGSQEVLLVKGTRYLYSIRVQSGQSMNHELFAPMIRVSAEDAYYDQYKGSSFTIDLNGTIYGGTLDVTTGVLTVDRVYEVLNGDYWIVNSWSGAGFTYDKNILHPRKNYSTSYEGLICSIAPVDSSKKWTARWISIAGTKVGLKDANGNVTLEQIKALAENGAISVVYELATPTTVQLTPTQISLLKGANYINASTGDVEITVSTPGSVTNPTLFESKPIIRMYGNGTVNIGADTITVSGCPYDFVDLDCETMDVHYGSSNANAYVSLSTDDYITLQPGENYITYSGFTSVRVTPRWYEI